MSKPIPLQYGETYHIYNRGNNGETIFREAENYRYFLTLYAKYISPIAETYAYCLLGNHFHFLLRLNTDQTWQVSEPSPKDQTWQASEPSPKDQTWQVSETCQVSPPPSRAFSNLFNAYTKAFNKRYRRTGSLFQKPFQRRLVTDERYFNRLLIYIHQNPQRHGFSRDFRDWPFSSYHALCSSGPTRLQRRAMLARFNGSDGLIQAHQEIVEINLPDF